jgi:putative N6-adenine-specific DNA methylase
MRAIFKTLPSGCINKILKTGKVFEIPTKSGKINMTTDKPMLNRYDEMQPLNPEKRIKRQVVGRRQDFFAVTLPGYETPCVEELKNLSQTLEVTEVLNGGVAFTGRLTDLYLANLHVRTAVRILMRLAHFKATNFKQLEARTRKIPWELFLPQGTLPALKVTARHSRLYHCRAVAEHMQESIAARWSEFGITPAPSEEQILFVRLQDDEATLSLDSSGRPLYRRGLKSHVAHAPLRETTAAAILSMAGYRPDMPLVDPMCGSGTFSLEAALMAKQMAPGLLRDFAFMQWPAFRPRQWAHYLKKAGEKRLRLAAPSILASDSDKAAVTRLQGCVNRNEIEDAVTVSHQDFFGLRPDMITRGPGLIVLNPPYGRRLSKQRGLEKRYQDIAAKLKKDFKGWRTALLVPNPGLAKRLGLDLKPMRLDHGGLKLTLLVGKIGAT